MNDLAALLFLILFSFCVGAILYLGLFHIKEQQLKEKTDRITSCENLSGENKAICLAVAKKSIKDCLLLEKLEERNLCFTMVSF